MHCGLVRPNWAKHGSKQARDLLMLEAAVDSGAEGQRCTTQAVAATLPAMWFGHKCSLVHYQRRVVTVIEGNRPPEYR